MKRALLSLGMGAALRSSALPIATGHDAGDLAYITYTPTVAVPAVIAPRDDGNPDSTVGSNVCSLSATLVDRLLRSAVLEAPVSASVCEVCR